MGSQNTDKIRSRVFAGVIVIAMALFLLPAVQALIAASR